MRALFDLLQNTPYTRTKRQIAKRLKRFSEDEVNNWTQQKIKEGVFCESHVRTALHEISEEHILQKIKHYIKNTNNTQPTIEDFVDLGINTVNTVNIDNINAHLSTLDHRDITRTLLGHIVDEVNRNINYLVITVDAEASPDRQSEDHVNRLIGGQFGEHRAGIFDMMDAADEQGVKITFYLDVLEEYRYKGEIADIAKEIHRRGHDLQLHAHPEIIPDEQWSQIMKKNWQQDRWSMEEADRMFTVMLDFFDKNDLPRPIAFRGGSYRYNSNTIRVLHEKEMKISSNYNAFIIPGRQPETWGYVAPFRWENSVLELPITYAPASCEKRLVVTDRIDERYYEKHEDPWGRMRKSASCYDHPRINTMILHSWSFLYKEELPDTPHTHYMTYKDEKRKEAFRAFLQSKPEDFKIVSVSELYALIEKGIIEITQEEKIAKIEDVCHLEENDYADNEKREQDLSPEDETGIEEHLRFDADSWFLNKTETVKNIDFSDNTMRIELNEKQGVFYVQLGNTGIDKFVSKENYSAGTNPKRISLQLKRTFETEIKAYIVFFNDEKKVSTKSYILKEGANTIDIVPKEDERYLRLLFRVDSRGENTIELSDLQIEDIKGKAHEIRQAFFSEHTNHTPDIAKEMQKGITHFEESGYTYVYEDNGTPSMLFFDTAFLNRSHRHADFFNVLLYEYDKNILVDAGEYTSRKNSPFTQYCMSTRAHNTVLIDNQDYRLDRKFFFASRLKIKEQHEHYYHLMASNVYTYMKTSHERHIFYRPQEFLLVVDLLRSEKVRDFKQIFHLHQDLELSEEGAYLKTEIDADTPMYIQMQSLDMPTLNMQSSLLYSRGLEGEIEGYRALGHNEIVENHVLINEAQSSHLVLGTMFSFGKERDIQIDASSQTQLHIHFDQYTKIIKGENSE